MIIALRFHLLNFLTILQPLKILIIIICPFLSIKLSKSARHNILVNLDIRSLTAPHILIIFITSLLTAKYVSTYLANACGLLIVFQLFFAQLFAPSLLPPLLLLFFLLAMHLGMVLWPFHPLTSQWGSTWLQFGQLQIVIDRTFALQLLRRLEFIHW